MTRLWPLLLGVAALALYAWSIPANRTEAEDAYSYALAVEEGPLGALLHRHHLLYAPVMRGIYLGSRSLGWHGRSLPVMTSVSMLSGALSVTLLAWLLWRRSRLPAPVAGLSAAGLAVSYGFWRYACEAEIYAPASLLALATLALAWWAPARPFHSVGSGLAGAVAVGFHIMNVFPVLLAAPLLLWRRRGLRAALVQVVTAIMLVAAAYVLAGPRWPGGTASGGDAIAREGGLSPAAFARAAVGLGQAMISGNFLFAQPRAAALISARFPYRMLEEERYMGLHASPIARSLPPMLLVALGIVAGWTVLRSLRRQCSSRSTEERYTLWAGLVWFVPYAGFILLFQPGNPELWVMALPALWLVAAAVVVGPAVRCGIAFPTVMILLLAAHNWAGGMMLLRNPAGDYNAAKAAWVAARARAGDTVVTAGGPVFSRYLRYRCAAEVVDAWRNGQLCRASGFSVDPSTAAAPAPGPSAQQILVMGDVFDPPASLKVRLPEAAGRISAFAASIRPRVRRIHDDEFGGVYLIQPNLPGTGTDAP